MLSPNELEAVPNGIARLFRALELDILNDITERLAVNRDISRTADWEINRLYELGVAKEVIRRQIKRTLRLSEEEIDRIYADVLAEDYARYAPIYQRLGKSFVPYRTSRSRWASQSSTPTARTHSCRCQRAIRRYWTTPHLVCSAAFTITTPCSKRRSGS